MEHRMLKALVAASLSLLLSLSSFAAPLYYPGVDAQAASAQYWIGRSPNPQQPLLTPTEITKLNAANLASEKTKMYDFSTLPATVDSVAIVERLSAYTPDITYYFPDGPVPQSVFTEACQNMRDPAASRSKAVRFALCVETTDIKHLPYARPISDELDDPEFDSMQNSRLLVGDGFAIIAQSVDKQWYYGYNYNMDGWVAAKDIAICQSRAQMQSYLQVEPRLVVTGSKIVLEQSTRTPSVSGTLLTMGTSLPLVKWDGVTKISGRLPVENNIVELPVRNADGSCGFQLAGVPLGRDAVAGYLPYTYNNLFHLLFEKQGDRYGWGSMLKADDCSSYLTSVYRCFGILLPRNTTAQVAMPTVVTNLRDYSDEQKLRVLSELPVGTMLQLPGHTMIFLGMRNDQPYVISSLSLLKIDPKGELLRPNTVSVTNLGTTFRASGMTWLSAITTAIEVRQPSFPDLEGIPEQDAILSLAAQGIARAKNGDLFLPAHRLTCKEAIQMLSLAYRVDESWLAQSITQNGTLAGTKAVSPLALNRAIAEIRVELGLPTIAPPFDEGAKDITRAAFCAILDAQRKAA